VGGYILGISVQNRQMRQHFALYGYPSLLNNISKILNVKFLYYGVQYAFQCNSTAAKGMYQSFENPALDLASSLNGGFKGP
jgi:hypothetical protein